MILVTCAAGKTGRAVVRRLLAGGGAVRAMVRRHESMEVLVQEYTGNSTEPEIICGDLTDRDAVSRALVGVDAVYYIAPNMNPDERVIGDIMIDGAVNAGVGRFVFHSVLHTQIEELAHHWERHFVEQAIINSGLSFTILQCGSYMQNMLPGWNTMINSGVHRMAYDVETPMSLVDLNDVAAVAVKILTEPGFENAIFEIAGPAITLREKAVILSRVLGQEIVAEKEALGDFLDHGRSLGFSVYTLAVMEKMFPYYDRHGLVGNAKTLGWLLGRTPTGFEEFVRRISEN
jgi:uncharacterized protein YbjT (DUF2867 family)